MNVIVLPRLAAEGHTQATPWAQIAITDPGRAPLPKSRCPRLRDRLHLAFIDVAPEDFRRYPAFERFRPFMLDARQAGQIIAFLDPHPTAELDWVVGAARGRGFEVGGGGELRAGVFQFGAETLLPPTISRIRM
ncbi:MAG: hypothetical protein IPI57_14985 [Candidatus Competibacteraceae bacterium]|nr:hypothetical protein [Candidatus Competibacteraceae bacterium]